MQTSKVRELCQINDQIELTRILLNDEVRFFEELEEVHPGNKRKDSRKMSYLLSIFKSVYSELIEEHDNRYELLQKIFSVTSFQEEIIKFLKMLKERNRTFIQINVDGLQGLW